MSLKDALVNTYLRAIMGFPVRENLRMIREDVNAFDAGGAIGMVIGLMIAIVFFAAIVGTVAYQLSLASNNASVKANSTAAALIPLILTVFVIAGVVFPVAAVLVFLKSEGKL